MSAFCGLKMGTQTNQLKFTATHLLSLEEQVLHSSLTLLHHLSKYEKDQDPVVQFVAQDLDEKIY